MEKGNKLMQTKFDEFSALMRKNNVESLVKVMEGVTKEFNKSLKELINKLLKLYQNSQQFDFQNRKGKGLEIVKTDRLFTQANGKPMHPNTPYKWLERMCKKNGLPFYGVHTFRHLNASLQINAGIDAVTVSATLGHFIVLSKLFVISITDLAAMEALYQVANIELIDTMSNETTKSSIFNVD